MGNDVQYPPFVEGWIKSQASSRDTIDVKRIYIDINDGDLIDGVIFSQIMYWNEPNKETGKTRLAVQKDGHYWLAKSYADWWEECRVNEYTARDAIKRMTTRRGLLIKRIFKYDNKPTVHIRVNWDRFEQLVRAAETPGALKELLDSLQLETTGAVELKRREPSNRNDVNRSLETTADHRTITETTTKTTTERKESSEPQSASVPAPAGNTSPDNPWIDLSIAKIQTAFKAGDINREDLPNLLAAEQAKDKPRDSLVKWLKARLNDHGNDKRPENFKDYVDVVFNAYDTSWIIAQDITDQLFGIAAKGEREKYNCDQPPISPEEIEGFTAWYKLTCKGYPLPKKASSLNQWWHDFKNRGNSNGRNAGSSSQSSTGSGEYRDSLYDFKGYQPDNRRPAPMQDVRR